MHPSAEETGRLLIATLAKNEIDAGNAPSAEPTSSQSSGDVGRGHGFYAHEEASGEGVDPWTSETIGAGDVNSLSYLLEQKPRLSADQVKMSST